MVPNNVVASFVGQTVGGRYAITRPLGEGGTSTVFEATDTQTGARVAVKFLHAQLANQRDMVARFQREINAGTRVQHPNVISVLGHGTTPDGRQYMVQEFLQGQPLTARIAHGALPPPEAVRIALAVLDGLAASHRVGILHRDIKPDNIYLCEMQGGHPHVKVIDFGMSKPLGEQDVAGPDVFRTNAGAALGTPEYMSPEQARGASDLDARTDVWSAAAVLFEMLAGRKMIQGGSLAMIITKLVMEPPPRIETVVQGLPPELVKALHGALEPDRNLRHAGPQEFRDALAAATGNAPRPAPAANAAMASTMAFEIPVGGMPMHQPPSGPAQMPVGIAPMGAPAPKPSRPSWEGATMLADNPLASMTPEQIALMQRAGAQIAASGPPPSQQGMQQIQAVNPGVVPAVAAGKTSPLFFVIGGLLLALIVVVVLILK